MKIGFDGLKSVLSKAIKPNSNQEKPQSSTPSLPSDSLSLTANATPPESKAFKVKKAIANNVFDITLPHAHALTQDQAEQLLPNLKQGDIFLRRVDDCTANTIIPGFWGHAALYVGNGEIIDAVGKGVRRVSVQDFFSEGDHAMVIRPKDLTEEQFNVMNTYAEKQLGKPYDYDIDNQDDSRYFCTELVSKALKEAYGKDFVEANILGGIAPEQFKTAQNFDLIWTSTPEESTLS